MKRAAVFVLSDVRSGSTLLDLCLGAHPSVVSLGEVHWLPAYVSQDRTVYDPIHSLLCTCGKQIRDCSFWRQVQTSLRRPLESLDLRLNFTTRDIRGSQRSIIGILPRRLVEVYPSLFRSMTLQWLYGCNRMARDCTALYDAVAAATGRPYCVDSSKSPLRFRALNDRDPARTLAIVLVRDYRAVVHSKMKRGQSLEAAAKGWRTRMAQIEALTGDVPLSRVHVLRYEALCEQPKEELVRLCQFLNLEFSESMLQRSTNNVHHIGGSPSKFDSSRVSISLDRSYEERFRPDELAKIRKLVGRAAGRWGY